MIRDTFETNPGLCELFKRKIISKAQCVGLSVDLIDFDAQIDMKGSYHDNLRTFYRAYPQLSQESDYARLKQPRLLSGAALEEAWLSYALTKPRETAESDQQQEDQRMGTIMPELTVTYSFGIRPDPTSSNTISPETVPIIHPLHSEANHSELVRLFLERVSAMAGEGVAKTILHHVGKEIGRSSFQHSRDQASVDLLAALDHALRYRGLGRVIALERADNVSSLVFTCTIAECSLCLDQASRGSTCDVMRGVLSRWLELLLQKKVENVEESCVDAETHKCIFKFTFRK